MIQRPSHNDEDVSLLRKWREAVTLAINKIRYAGPSVLTIASGVISITRDSHLIETEGASATDNLDTINGGFDGQEILLRAYNTSHTVVVKNGTGNIRCGTDMSLDSKEDTITLTYAGDLMVWLELSRANNA